MDMDSTVDLPTTVDLPSTGKPLIGLSSYAEPARWAAWHAPAALLPLNYAEQVAAAGGIPVLLPPVPGIAAAVGRLDGLVLTGGGDIDPAAYGAAPHPRTGSVNAARDQAELQLLAAALAAGRPILGICRGLQLLNTAMGGTLHQHLADLGPAGDAGHTPEPGTFGRHPVRVAAGSRLSDILGADGPLLVPTAHHQAIDRLGAGLTATAWAADGIVEAAELTGGDHHPFVLAVQWHPEAGDDPRLMRALIAAAATPHQLRPAASTSHRLRPVPRPECPGLGIPT
jgi:putative glutamine amidotransferase